MTPERAAAVEIARAAMRSEIHEAEAELREHEAHVRECEHRLSYLQTIARAIEPEPSTTEGASQ